MQDGVQYTLDLNAGLTQVLADGTNTYLYGLGRIAERQGTASEYYLGDALGSVRQIANGSGNVILARNYDPFGKTAQTIGTAQTDFGFTGEFTDASGLIYLRARYYESLTGRFTTRDTFEGDVNTPASLNRFNYAHSNPVMNTDPSGHCIFAGVDTVLCAAIGGGIAGGVIGGAYAKWMYHLAYTGKCGCEGQQLISQYTEAQFVMKAAGAGALFGAAFGALSSVGAGGAAIAALAGMGFSGAGINNSVQRLQTDPSNQCAWLDFGLSVFGLVASGVALGNAVGKIGGGAPASIRSSKGLFGNVLNDSEGNALVQEAINYHSRLAMQKRVTIAVSRINGRKVVSINGNARPESVTQLKSILDAEGVELLFREGGKSSEFHAERVMYDAYKPRKIGISNSKGPCHDGGCWVFFKNLQNQGLIDDVFYPNIP